MIDVRHLPDGRIVVHYLNFLKPGEIGSGAGSMYPEAVERAKAYGGKRYRARWYGGGIVFNCSLSEIETAVKAVRGEE